MPGRSLGACIAAAMLAHGLLIWALAHAQASGQAGEGAAPSVRVLELVRTVDVPPRAALPAAGDLPAPPGAMRDPSPPLLSTRVPALAPTPTARAASAASAPDALPVALARPASATASADASPAAPASTDRPSALRPSISPTADFVASADLERPALPRSAPDTSLLANLPWSGLPTRLRLFIDAKGTVVDVVVLQTSEADAVVERMRQMFLATGFVPGRLHGVDVPSTKDLELVVGDGP